MAVHGHNYTIQVSSAHDGELVQKNEQYSTERQVRRRVIDCEDVGEEEVLDLADGQERFDVTIKTLVGETLTVKACGNDTVDILKQQICSLKEIPVVQQRMIYAGAFASVCVSSLWVCVFSADLWRVWRQRERK